jgi:5-methylcytosine-specific restriction endonuclease McrA
MKKIVTHKKCGKCNKTKAASGFYNASNHKDGISSSCKSCTDEYNKIWVSKNRSKAKGYIAKWFELHKEQEKERLRKYKLENKEKVRESARKYTSENSEKINKYGREYYKKNRDAKLEKCRIYRSNNPDKNLEYSRNRRARKMKNCGSITSKEWEDLRNKYGNRCLCCGRSGIELTLDHVLPLSMGGEHSINNAQPLCRSCNSSKNDKHIDYRPK